LIDCIELTGHQHRIKNQDTQNPDTFLLGVVTAGNNLTTFPIFMLSFKTIPLFIKYYGVLINILEKKVNNYRM